MPTDTSEPEVSEDLRETGEFPSEPDPEPVAMWSVHVEMPKRKFGRGHLLDTPDERDWQANGLLGAPRNLPGEASLEPFVKRVLDQGSSESCVGHAIAQAADIRLGKLGFESPPVSPLAIYTLARELARAKSSEPLEDAGSYARLAFKGARDFGLVSEDKWPLDMEHVNDDLPWDVLQAGSAFKVASWYRIASRGIGRVHDICNAIAQGWPVVFAVDVDQSFLDFVGKGRVPAYDPKQGVGGHMLCLVGYATDGPEKVFRVVNSWGESWGDHGFFWADQAWIAADTINDVYVTQVAGS